MIKKIIKKIFSLLVVVLLIDPADKLFHLKIPLYLILIVFWIGLKFKNSIKYKADSLWVFTGLFLISLFSILIAAFQNSDIDYSFSTGFLKSLSILFLLLMVIDLDLEPDLMLNKNSFLIVIITIVIYVISFINPLFFDLVYGYLVVDKGALMLANRNFYGYELLMVFYKTSPILVFPLSYYCNKMIFENRKLLSFIIVVLFFTAIFMSGTRANIVSGVIILIYYFYQFLKFKRNALYNIIGIFFVFLSLIYFILSLSLQEKEDSAEVKSGHFSSFISNIQLHPQYLLWGQGLGSKSYSSGTGEMVAQTELTYFDLVRFFGLPLTFLFLFFIIYPLIYLYKNKMFNDRNNYIIIAFLTYLFIAGTNPLLISSTGMLIIIVMYSFLNSAMYLKHQPKVL